jgi:hypothetical protein
VEDNTVFYPTGIVQFQTDIIFTISLEMPVPSQGHYGFHSFPVVESSVILLLPLFTITMPNVTAGGIFFPRGHYNLVALLKHLNTVIVTAGTFEP